MMKKCKYHKYNKDTYEDLCTLLEVVCDGDKSRQKNCVVAQLLNECEKYENALESIKKICNKSSKEWEVYIDETCTFYWKTRKTDRAKFADKILNIIKKAKDSNNEQL